MTPSSHDDIIALVVSAGFGLALMLAFAAGRIIRRRLPQHHRSREMADMLLAVIAMLVTFSAIALGLMLNSSLDRLQHLNTLVSALAEDVVRLDDTLVQYGRGGQLAHVAAANYIRREALGIGDPRSTELTRAALQQIEAVIVRLEPPDVYHESVKHDALARYGDVADIRFRLVAEGSRSSNLPFDLTLAFWLVLTYFTFGLNTDENLFIVLALALSMCAVVAASFVILDAGTALGGLISVSRDPLDLALAALSHKPISGL